MEIILFSNIVLYILLDTINF